MSVADFVSKVFSVARGNKTFFPRFTLMRMVGKERKEEGLDKKTQKLINDIRKDEEKGELKELEKDEKDFAKDITKEIKIENAEVQGEEKIEMQLVHNLGECIEALKNDKERQKKIIELVKQIESFSSEQLNDLKQVEEGGKPWLGVAGVMKYDIGQCGNIAITTARSMRMSWSKMNSAIKDIITLARDLKGKKKEDAEKKIDRRITLLKKKINEFLSKIKLHYLVSLRLFRFLTDELKHEKEHVKQMEEKEGLPEPKANEMEKGLDKALKEFKEDVKAREAAANKLVQEEERLAAAA